MRFLVTELNNTELANTVPASWILDVVTTAVSTL